MPTKPSADAWRRVAVGTAFAGLAAPLFSISASQILLAVSLAAMLLAREPLAFPPVKLPLGLFLGWTVLAVLFSGNALAGWPQIRKFYVILLTLASAATLFRKTQRVTRLVLLWAAGAACAAAWAVAQYFSRYSAVYDEMMGQRITGFMGHWMTFSGELNIVLLMLAAFLLFSPERRAHWRWLVPSAALIALGLLLALTRGPWFGLAAGLLYLLWQWNRKAVALLPVVAVLVFFASPRPARERMVSIVKPHSEKDAYPHRLLLWRTSVEMIKQHPWFGVGPERFQTEFNRINAGRQLPWGWYGHAHNIYLQYAAERGIPALLFFLWLVGQTIVFCRLPSPNAREAWLPHACIAVIVGILVAGIFEHNLGDSEVLQMFLTVLAAGYAAAGLPAARQPQRPDAFVQVGPFHP